MSVIPAVCVGGSCGVHTLVQHIHSMDMLDKGSIIIIISYPLLFSTAILIVFPTNLGVLTLSVIKKLYLAIKF